MGIIYCYKSPEGKEYVGQTRRKLQTRDQEHIKESKGSNSKKFQAFHKALNEFGRDRFTLDILKECLNNELNTWEKHYIAERNSLYPNGYNLRAGGGGGAEVCQEYTNSKH